MHSGELEESFEKPGQSVSNLLEKESLLITPGTILAHFFEGIVARSPFRPRNLINLIAEFTLHFWTEFWPLFAEQCLLTFVLNFTFTDAELAICVLREI